MEERFPDGKTEGFSAKGKMTMAVVGSYWTARGQYQIKESKSFTTLRRKR